MWSHWESDGAKVKGPAVLQTPAGPNCIINPLLPSKEHAE
jgi:hypothetical protein